MSNHMKKAMHEHHMLGEMINKSLKGAKHRKAMKEHHFLGNLIRGIGSMAGPVLKGIGAIAGPAAALAGTGMAFHQMRQSNKAAAAQERMMHAQAQSIEDQNAYMKKHAEAENQARQPQRQKKGGRTKCN